MWHSSNAFGRSFRIQNFEWNSLVERGQQTRCDIDAESPISGNGQISWPIIYVHSQLKLRVAHEIASINIVFFLFLGLHAKSTTISTCRAACKSDGIRVWKNREQASRKERMKKNNNSALQRNHFRFLFFLILRTKLFRFLFLLHSTRSFPSFGTFYFWIKRRFVVRYYCAHVIAFHTNRN